MFFFTVKFSLLELRWAFDTISSLSLTPQAVSAGSPLSTTIPLPSATVSSAPLPPAHTRVAHRNLAASGASRNFCASSRFCAAALAPQLCLLHHR